MFQSTDLGPTNHLQLCGAGQEMTISRDYVTISGSCAAACRPHTDSHTLTLTQMVNTNHM